MEDSFSNIFPKERKCDIIDRIRSLSRTQKAAISQGGFLKKRSQENVKDDMGRKTG